MAKIMLADDDPVFRTMLAERFLDAGFEVEEAANGNEALAKLKDFKADLLIADVNMPGLGGIELVKKIRTAHHMRKIPVIFMTGSNYSELVVSRFAPELKYQCLMNKMAELEVILEKVRSLLIPPAGAD